MSQPGLRDCLVGLLGARVGTPTTTLIPTLMGTQATRVIRQPPEPYENGVPF
jgi:hypothetical protein